MRWIAALLAGSFVPAAAPALAQEKTWPRGKPEVYWGARKKCRQGDYVGAIADFTKSIPLVGEKARNWRARRSPVPQCAKCKTKLPKGSELCSQCGAKR